MTYKTRMWINGAYVASVENKTFTLENPATLQQFANVHQADTEDLERAVDAVETAQSAWASRSAYDCAEVLRTAAKVAEMRGCGAES